MVGFSEGNGHPFSWSALVNGYRAQKLVEVPFEAIRGYLPAAERIGPRLGAEITNVWTPNPELSRQIASFAKIEKVSSDLESLVSDVDAILHARDDFENHGDFIDFYAKFRKPVFIDKPIAMSRRGLSRVLAVDPNFDWVFSCSALAYDPMLEKLLESGAQISNVSAWGPKTWPKYGVHLAEPALKLLGYPAEVTNRIQVSSGNSKRLEVKWGGGFSADLTTSGEPGGKFIFDTDVGTIVMQDPSAAFSRAIEAFVGFARGEKFEGRKSQIIQLVDLLEFGMKN